MKVYGFMFDGRHEQARVVRVQTENDSYSGKITLHALCPLGANKWRGWSADELSIFEQIGQILSTC